jgi:hypothetical protein
MPVFISYSRIDETVVKTLAQGLEAAKRDVWSDHNLAGGDVWWDAILANIRSSEVFLFALSDASLNSKPCRLELDYALALERPVLPVQVGAVTSLRANPLAELQIIGYRADDAHSGFAVLSAVEEATQRVRPLPEPLPPPPPIPFKYLLALGQQIDSTELSVEEQKAVVDQLRRALDEETDESVRRDILGMLRNLDSKPFTTKRTQKGIAALLLVHGPDGEAGTADTSTPAEVAAGPAVPAARLVRRAAGAAAAAAAGGGAAPRPRPGAVAAGHRRGRPVARVVRRDGVGRRRTTAGAALILRGPAAVAAVRERRRRPGRAPAAGPGMGSRAGAPASIPAAGAVTTELLGHECDRVRALAAVRRSRHVFLLSGRPALPDG